MGIYLPIAELSVNVLVLLGMGAAVGFLSGMFGVGGGFLITPLLIFYNIPPAIAVATGANQVVASSISGAIAHFRSGTLDFKLGTVLLVGGLVGSTLGIWIFSLLRSLGQLDLIISLMYVVFLGTVGGLMLRESVNAIRRARGGEALSMKQARPAQLDSSAAAEDAVQGIEALCQRHSRPRAWRRHRHPVVGHGRRRRLHHGAGADLSPAASRPTSSSAPRSSRSSSWPPTRRSCRHTTNQTVDIVLAFVLMVGGVVGAQYGAQVGQKLRGEQLRALLALLVLAVALRLAFDLFLPPEEHLFDRTGDLR